MKKFRTVLLVIAMVIIGVNFFFYWIITIYGSVKIWVIIGYPFNDPVNCFPYFIHS